MSIFTNSPVLATSDTKVNVNWWNKEVYEKMLEIDSAIMGFVGIPSGVICMWSGQIIDIPNGWYLCNGNNGTPNLVDRFIVGAGNSYAVGATGGEATHVLSLAEMPAHNHGAVGDHSHTYYRAYAASGVCGGGGQYQPFSQIPAEWTGGAGGHTHSTQGSNTAHENRPPYYALAFIMKL